MNEASSAALAKGRRLGMLAAARIADRHAREAASGEAARKGELNKLRDGKKNVRRGENAYAMQSHGRMWGYFLDRKLIAEAISKDIRTAQRRG